MKSTGMFEFLGKLSAVWYVIINKSGKKNATHAILFNHILKITWQEPDFCHALWRETSTKCFISLIYQLCFENFVYATV